MVCPQLVTTGHMKCRLNVDLLVDKKIFLKPISEYKRIAGMEVGHEIIEIRLLINRARSQDGRLRLVLQAFLIKYFECCGFFWNVFASRD